ncbi:hypothetical protein JOB18_013977 [Solea senegalensis]|uniref:Uncharacterized protein n=1 Tax=Solea senegalensis TaxID=28829 RepID=A0AAV6R6P3_SOLSE|nr:hypothetical protein JOB18_013977 [Solea senegalensis]
MTRGKESMNTPPDGGKLCSSSTVVSQAETQFVRAQRSERTEERAAPDAPESVRQSVRHPPPAPGVTHSSATSATSPVVRTHGLTRPPPPVERMVASGVACARRAYNCDPRNKRRL